MTQHWFDGVTKPDERLALTAAFNSCGSALFDRLCASPGNIVFSPFSIGSAMAMALSGARGDTAAEMARILRQPLDRDRMGAAYADVLTVLYGYSRRANLDLHPDGKWPSATLSVANALFGAGSGEGINLVSDAYVQHLKRDYFAEVFRDADLDAINRWVSDKTNGKIERILEGLPGKNSLALVNTLYLKLAWVSQFRSRDTTSEDFHLSTGQTVKVPTMHLISHYALVERQDYRAISIPFKAVGQLESLSMIVVLPAAVEGTNRLIQEFASEGLAGLPTLGHDAGAVVRTALALPGFRVRFGCSLAATFRSLGLSLPFDPHRADFSGITGRSPEELAVWIDQIVHQATLDVTEEGIEAAAATAIGMKTGAPPRAEPTPFIVDRPFLFYITDATTAAILFAGRISDPRVA